MGLFVLGVLAGLTIGLIYSPAIWDWIKKQNPKPWQHLFGYFLGYLLLQVCFVPGTGKDGDMKEYSRL